MRHCSVLAGPKLDISDEHRLQQTGHHQSETDGEENICGRNNNNDKVQENEVLELCLSYRNAGILVFSLGCGPAWDKMFTLKLEEPVIHLLENTIVVVTRFLIICMEVCLISSYCNNQTVTRILSQLNY